MRRGGTADARRWQTANGPADAAPGPVLFSPAGKTRREQLGARRRRCVRSNRRARLYGLTRFGAMGVTKPYNVLCFGDARGSDPMNSYGSGDDYFAHSGVITLKSEGLLRRVRVMVGRRNLAATTRD